MKNETINGLDLVPPHRREEIRRRVEVVRRYIATRRGAEASAAELGISLTSFWRLVRAWEKSGSAFDLPGAGSPKTMPDAITPEQRRVIATAIADKPGEIIERVAERAMAIAHAVGLRMPGWAALTKHIGISLAGRLPTASPAMGADLVIEHCVIDLPVAHPSSPTGTMPMATIVTAVADARVIGLSLEGDGPTATGAAAALVQAFGNVQPSRPSRPIALFMNSLVGPDWDELRRSLEGPDIHLSGSVRDLVSPPTATIRLIGRRIAGISIMARLGRRPAIARPATVWPKGEPLALAEVERMMRARWTPAADPVRLPVDDSMLSTLADALRRF